MPKLSVSSVIIGQLVDKALFIPLVIVLVAMVGTDGAVFPLAALALGGACTLAGSFVAASRAKDAYLAHGVAVGAVTLLISFARFLVAQFRAEPLGHSIGWEVTSRATALLAGLAGGYIAKKRDGVKR